MILRFLFTAVFVASLVLHYPLAPSLYAQVVDVPAEDADEEEAPPELVWHDVTKWGVEGRAWPEMPRKRWFQRLPDAAQGKVDKPVWQLGQDSTGMMVRFKTDATTIWAHYALSRKRLALPHMPATGVSGLDLYARDAKGKWRWIGVTKTNEPEMKLAIIAELSPQLREYAVYLPLYNGLESLSLGVPVGAKFEGLAPRTQSPIVFYGTSITQGASASRPGMAYTAILGRMFDRPVVNLGFSGTGRMDAAVGDLMVKMDAAAFVLDCVPNMNPAEVREKGPALVKQLRAAHPKIPIILVEDLRNTNSWALPKRDQYHTDRQTAIREVYEGLKREGVADLHYVPDNHLVGDDGDGTIDGSHPNDLGFMRMSEALAPVLREVLPR